MISSTLSRRAALVAAGIAGALTLAAARAPERAGQPRTGAQVYASTCAACHQPQGEGTGEAYPPLAGSPFVTGPEGRLVRILLHGITGELEIDGQIYSGLMPGWGTSLDDAELAAVATYIRTSWGNQASAVTPATVAGIRGAHAGRTTPWTVAELARVLPVQKP